MVKRPWGRLVQREVARLLPLLVAGCAHAPPPEPAPVTVALPTPPPLPPRPSPLAEPGPVVSGVGALVDVDEKPTGEYGYAHVQKLVPFGAGVLVFVGFEQDEYARFPGDPKCSIVHGDPSACFGVVIAPWKDGSRAKVWPRMDGDASLGPYRPFVPTTAAWEHFSPGRQGVYASRKTEDRLAVDYIDAQGVVSLFVEDTEARFDEVEIAETPEGHVAVFRESTGGLVAGRIVKDASGKRRIELGKRLRIGDVNAWDPRATDAREARKKEGRASFGELRLVSPVDARGEVKSDLVLVWVEAIPPKSYEEEHPEPPAKPPPRKLIRKGASAPSKDQCGKLDRAPLHERFMSRRGLQDDNGCSGRRSRFLSDATVKKKLHLTRLSTKGVPGTDREVTLPSTYDARKQRLEVRALADGGLAVGTMAFDASLRLRAKALEPSAQPDDPTFRGPPSQAVFGAAFDPLSGEALLLYREATESGAWGPTGPGAAVDTVRARRYTALGERVGRSAPVGAAVNYETLGNAPRSAKLGAGWMALTAHGALEVIGGPHHRATHPLPSVPSADGTGVFCVTPAECDAQVRVSGIGARPDGAAELVLRAKSGTYLATLDGRTLLADALRALPLPDDAHGAWGPSGALRDDAGGMVWWTYDARSGVAVVRDGAAEPLPGQTPRTDKPQVVSLHQVWDDAVVVVSGPSGATATWLRAKKTLSIDPAALVPVSTEKEPMYLARGPVLPSGAFVLPSEPGPLLPAPPALARALVDCPVAMATGPRRLLLACAEPVSAELPSVRAGVRIVRY